eukprot:6613219-Karenia_brevis.AAC.1
MANIYIEDHYEELVNKQRVIKLFAARDGDLKQRLKEHTYDASDGCVPETIRMQAQVAMDKEPLQLKVFPSVMGSKALVMTFLYQT